MLMVSQEKRRAALVKALEIALGVHEVNDSPGALRAWSDLVLEFKRHHRADAQMLLQHLQSGAVLVCALQPRTQPSIDPAESDKAPA